MNESDVEAAMKAAGLTAGDVVSIELGPEPTNPGIWRVSWDETQSDPDWEPDHAIISRLRENERQCLGRIAALEAERAELEDFARKRTLAHQSACDDYEDMLAVKDARLAALEACNAALTKALATNLRALNAALAAFTADQPDLPDPPRRPDGTLMPQPKALTLPRETGDKRRVGS